MREEGKKRVEKGKARERGQKDRTRKRGESGGFTLERIKKKRKRKLHNEHSIFPVCEFPWKFNIFNKAS